jgi:hypothetical protein
MKITNSQLRQIIREDLIQNIDEMAFAKTLTGHDGKHIVLPGRSSHWSGPEGSTSAKAFDPETTSRYLGSKKFNDDAIRLYANVPFNVWLAPVLSKDPDTSINFVDPKFGYSRIKVLNLAYGGLEFLEKTGFAGIEEINPTKDLVVLPVGLNVMKGYTTSPWVIMHGVFDSIDTINIISELVPGAMELLKDIEKDPDLIWHLLKSLTMYSARTHQFTLDAPSDMVAEMFVQEIFDKRRLRFNFDEVKDPDMRNQITEVGDRVKKLAQLFITRAPGKLILVRQ